MKDCSSCSKIKAIVARQIFDSRGKPTLEVEVTTDKGTFTAAVPSGASTGKYEACELRDGISNEYQGFGVSKAMENVNKIIGPSLISSGLKVEQQSTIDEFLIKLDGTPNKSKLGANAILGVSLAVARAAACHNEVPLYKWISKLSERNPALPIPCFNVINGGCHAGNSVAIQEMMIVPIGATSFKDAMKMGTETFHVLKGLIKKNYGIGAINVGDEGGFAPLDLVDVEDALSLIVKAIADAGYEGKIKIALDCAASEFYVESKEKGNFYDLSFKLQGDQKASALKRGAAKTPAQLIEYYEQLARKFPIVSIEDPFDQDDFDAWTKLTAKLVPNGIQIVGDDLTVTNIDRIKRAQSLKSCNTLLLKVNQIGTLTESIAAAKLAFTYGWGVMVSHRSGETEDSFIADLVVGLGTGQIKTGAPCRSERLSKMNQLLRIEEMMGKASKIEVPPAFQTK